MTRLLSRNFFFLSKLRILELHYSGPARRVSPSDGMTGNLKHYIGTRRRRKTLMEPVCV